MAGKFFRTDGGMSFRSGARTAPPRQNAGLRVRPEGGRAPNFKSGGNNATQQSTMPPGQGTANGILSALSWVPGGAQLAGALSAGAGIGNWMEQNLDVNTAGSGRGSGRAAFTPPSKGSGRRKASGTVITIDGKRYDTGYHSKEIAELRKKYPGGGNAAQAQSIDKTKPAYIEPAGNGGDRLTPAPNGGGGTGTQLSPRQMTMEEANALLTGGYKVMNPFSSTQLPATSASPYFKEGQSPQYRSDVPEDTYNPQLSTNLTDGSPFNTDGYKYEVPTHTNVEYLQEEGSPKIALSGNNSQTNAVNPSNTKSDSPTTERSARIPKRPKGERAAAMWDRQYGRMDQSTTKSETKGSGIDYARRSAFLDADSSLQGLRRVEAQKGIVYAGAQHHMVNPNQGQEGQSDFIAIDKGDRDAYMGGRMTAGGLKDKYVKDVKAATKSEPVSPKNVGDNYQITESQTPTSRIDATAQVDTGVITKAPTLMEEVDVRYTDKDKSGRYNVF